MVTMFRILICVLSLHFPIFASGIANFKCPKQNKDIVFFLSTPKSGSNVITGCLSALTRKPIAWFYWGTSILDPLSNHRNHLSYNRLGLQLISETPLLYRTHYEFYELRQVPSNQNKLIFVTRNPKELLYREFFLQNSLTENPNTQFINAFLSEYLKAFDVYELWCSENKFIVFYEDFIIDEDRTLLQLVQFMNEPPLFLDDFLNNKQEYLSKLLKSYSNQHQHNLGGSSSICGPTPIYYSRNASWESLRYIDEYLKINAPELWDKYFQRFQAQLQ